MVTPALRAARASELGCPNATCHKALIMCSQYCVLKRADQVNPKIDRNEARATGKGETSLNQKVEQARLGLDDMPFLDPPGFVDGAPGAPPMKVIGLREGGMKGPFIEVGKVCVYDGTCANPDCEANNFCQHQTFPNPSGAMASEELVNRIPPPPTRLLGSRSAIPQSPGEAVIECVPNPHPDTNYVARFTCPEFTSLCPVTGQPDFAHIVIDYVPGPKLVESKALKLFLFSFRDHGSFHEDCTITIGKRLAQACEPKWLKISAYWYPRGGIPIDVFWEWESLPLGVNPPPDYVPNYRGRG